MKYKYLLISIIFLSISGCDGSSSLVPQNPIFSGTLLIDTYEPSGNGAGNFPLFQWTSPSSVTYQVVGVFSTHIVVSGKQIMNKNDCFAMWDTGLTGSAGTVSYSKFVKVVNGAPTSTPVTALSNGTYYWAVWAMDDAMVVSNSSAEVSFSH